MKKPLDEKELTAQAKALFDDSVERLDAATLSRLNQGRQQALQEIRDTGGYDTQPIITKICVQSNAVAVLCLRYMSEAENTSQVVAETVLE